MAEVKIDGERESRIHLRTIELYKPQRASSPVKDGWLDDDLWAKCAREAREEIKGNAV